jgi:hypothetical protein
MKNDPNLVRPAETKDEATHRYPTSVRWGRGYFNDLMRYIVASSDYDALIYMRRVTGGNCDWHNLQRRSQGTRWEMCARYEEPTSDD